MDALVISKLRTRGGDTCDKCGAPLRMDFAVVKNMDIIEINMSCRQCGEVRIINRDYKDRKARLERRGHEV